MKDAAGRVHHEGKIGSSRVELDNWIRAMPHPRGIAMEATIFTGWIYDHPLPHAEMAKLAHLRSHELALVRDKEPPKGNKNCATLGVARKIVTYMLAVERRQQDFVSAENMVAKAVA